MRTLELYYGTNRGHKGRDRDAPTGYSKYFSSDGMENLRFGKVTVKADPARIAKYLTDDKACGIGNGKKLSSYLGKLAGKRKATTIKAFPEKIVRYLSDKNQPSETVYGSKTLFSELQSVMLQNHDILIYIHGYNVSWNDAVGAALALHEMLNISSGHGNKKTMVVLFSWPSDGMALPYVSYKSDRSEAQGSGYAFGRSLLKLVDFLVRLRSADRKGDSTTELCNQELHLLCHSMGNYVLQSSLQRIAQFSPGPAMPRLFEHIFLCSPDVDDNVLEPGEPMGRLHELSRHVSIYYNRGDLALHISDHTKGNPERLGTNGAARPGVTHTKIHQIDCSRLVHGVVEHSYYLCGNINMDIRKSIAGLSQDDTSRPRTQSPKANNCWIIK